MTYPLLQQSKSNKRNHFLEIGLNSKNEICITIHSGSRNPGHSVCGYYSKRSRLVDKDLPDGYLHLDSEMGQMYLQDMNFMLNYALANRMDMMESALKALGISQSDVKRTDLFINENHNHAIVTPEGVLHRKGATPAEVGQYGVIPGNMFDGTYITRGLGNEEFLKSASHGAGRVYGRNKMKRRMEAGYFTFGDVQYLMQDVACRLTKSMMDEAPEAYKPIKEVLAAQEGIVIEVVDHVDPKILLKR